MRSPRLDPVAYRRITLAATLMLAAIIVTGGTVRLTGSGLGCPDWPNCNPGHLVPRDASDVNAMVEFVNRVFTGLVSLSVILAVLGSLVRVPRRRDLVWLSMGLVLGVVAQAVLGGMTVIFELQPELVMAHFLLSLVLLTNAIVLHRRASEPQAPPRSLVGSGTRRAGRAVLVAAAAVVTTGTIVTATGPHGGDEEARRFSFGIADVAKVHGITVAVFMTIVVATLVRLWRTSASTGVRNRLLVVVGVALGQALIGYVQYFNGIPAVLVGFHIAGATALWAATVHFYLGLSTRGAPASGSIASGATPSRSPALART